MSEAWKNLERATADALRGERVVEPWYLFHERPDVIVELPDGRRLICECKYRKRFAHHNILDDCATRYCINPDDVPCLVSKHHGQRGAYVTIPIAVLAELLRDA